MKLWVIKRRGETPYDEYAGFVVRAPNEKSAREIARTFNGGVQGDWGTQESWTCKELTNDGDEEIILTDFRAG